MIATLSVFAGCPSPVHASWSQGLTKAKLREVATYIDRVNSRLQDCNSLV
jgi:hypothetical protein